MSHSLSVVRYPDQGPPAFFDLNGDPGTLRVNGIFHKLLDHGSRPLDNFAGGNSFRYFRRQDNDILLDLNISFVQAALGDKIKVPTLEGEEDLAVPAGTQSGTTFRLRGKGVPYLRRSGRGDQVVRVNVRTPTKLTAKQKELLKQLGESLGYEVTPQESKSFFDRVKDAFGV